MVDCDVRNGLVEHPAESVEPFPTKTAAWMIVTYGTAAWMIVTCGTVAWNIPLTAWNRSLRKPNIPRGGLSAI